MPHTPGPWKFLERDDPKPEYSAVNPFTICETAGEWNDLASVYSRDDATVSVTREEAYGNAVLMAAAPAMLALLRRVPLGDDSGNLTPLEADIHAFLTEIGG